MAVFIVVSCLNPTFRDVVTKPDNIPIVGMLFLVVFFTWLAVHKMVINDRLIDEGKDVENKKEAKELVFTWPDLVFSEFICSIICWCVVVAPACCLVAHWPRMRSHRNVKSLVLNLLPVPILDGGQILLTLAEGVRGKPFSIRVRELFLKVGVALILVLFAIVMFNDLRSLVRSWIG